MASSALSVERMNTYYGQSHALRDVSFEVSAGQLMVLLGRNGVGKTTTLRSIMGLTPPRTGGVELFGERIHGRSPEALSKLGIALVPQGRGIFASLTVRENLTVAARRTSDQKFTVDGVMRLFPRLAERSRQLAGTLSGGEQQMLAIGRALVNNPRILLMDEPTEGLAPAIVEEVQRIIRELKAWGMTILLVEQNTKFALSLADTIVILNAGRVAFSGAPAEIANDEAFLSRHLGVH